LYLVRIRQTAFLQHTNYGRVGCLNKNWKIWTTKIYIYNTPTEQNIFLWYGNKHKHTEFVAIDGPCFCTHVVFFLFFLRTPHTVPLEYKYIQSRPPWRGVRVDEKASGTYKGRFVYAERPGAFRLYDTIYRHSMSHSHEIPFIPGVPAKRRVHTAYTVYNNNII